VISKAPALTLRFPDVTTQVPSNNRKELKDLLELRPEFPANPTDIGLRKGFVESAASLLVTVREDNKEYWA
jgi:hypothetical protein